MHEHAFDLGGLVGTAEPAGDPHIGAATGRAARQHRREIAGREPDHRVIRVERGNDHLADLAGRNRLAGARPHDLDEHGLVDDHALAARALVGDNAEIGGGIALQHIDAARSEFPAQ